MLIQQSVLENRSVLISWQVATNKRMWNTSHSTTTWAQRHYCHGTETRDPIASEIDSLYLTTPKHSGGEDKLAVQVQTPKLSGGADNPAVQVQ